MTQRSILALHPAARDDIADLETRRPLPGPRVEQIDPYLFLNHHGPQIYPPHNRGLPFGPHPHRGFETVTFILEGELAHSDTGGHESVIRAGGVQWMTAGSGLVHAELSPAEFKEKGGPLEVLQLWVNLPSRFKMTAPKYIGLQREDIPSVMTFDKLGRVNVIAGEWAGTKGPVDSLIGHFMSTIELKPEGRVVFTGLEGRNVFLYVVRGMVNIGDRAVAQFHLVELTPQGDALEITARTESVLLFGHAQPIGEPVVSHGPFVMNTHEEIRQAIRDYQAGRFGSPQA